MRGRPRPLRAPPRPKRSSSDRPRRTSRAADGSLKRSKYSVATLSASVRSHRSQDRGARRTSTTVVGASAEPPRIQSAECLTPSSGGLCSSPLPDVDRFHQHLRLARGDKLGPPPAEAPASAAGREGRAELAPKEPRVGEAVRAESVSPPMLRDLPGTRRVREMVGKRVMPRAS